MINAAIFWKTMRDSSTMFVAASLGITAFVVLFVKSMLGMGKEVMAFVSQFEFLKKIFQFGFGIDVAGDVSIGLLFAACFTHALVFMLSWSVLVGTTSRICAGEIERGTADLLLTLPVTRSEVYCSSSLVWFLFSLVLAVCPVVGVWIGTLVFEISEPIDISRYFVPALNFCCLLLAIGGISSLISSSVNRRGLAIGILAGILVLSVVLNFVEPFIDAIQRIRFLGLLTYFRPVDIFRTGHWPIAEMFTLIAMAVSGWLGGLFIFCHKDIPTGG